MPNFAANLSMLNLRWAALEAARQGIDVLIVPINTRDMPGSFLNRQDRARHAIEDVGVSNLNVQMDLYHCQIKRAGARPGIR